MAGKPTRGGVTRHNGGGSGARPREMQLVMMLAVGRRRHVGVVQLLVDRNRICPPRDPVPRHPPGEFALGHGEGRYPWYLSNYCWVCSSHSRGSVMKLLVCKGIQVEAKSE